MTNLNELRTWLEGRLPALLAEHQVPGAAVAVSVKGEVIEAAAGVLNKNTGVEVTTDSLFQVGSITKLWTATLIMQLVDEGKIDLDVPVTTYLPGFRLKDESAAAVVTTRQLLSHTAGFEGDIFTDTGQGDDAISKLVETFGEVPQLFTPGTMFSYNNAAYVVLGRMMEVLRGKPYDECLREFLFAPLELTHAANGPYEAILFRTAVGHIVQNEGEEPQVSPIWALPRSTAPVGAMLTMSPRDLLKFAQMHLDSGRTGSGEQILSATSAAAMLKPQVKLPDLGWMGAAWGLGFALFDYDGGTVVGHDGGTIGQTAFLRLCPEKDVSLALFCNGGTPLSVFTEIGERVLREFAGIGLPQLPAPSESQTPVDASRYVGQYCSQVADVVVSQDAEGRIWLERTPKGLYEEVGDQTEKIELVAAGGDNFLPAQLQYGMHLPHVFLGDDGEGRALFVHTGRADRRANA
ncbi:Penicillin-binding protein 4 [Arthrobacter sp. 9V]|uniref:serine hydrolase domain-containing protein n=1 Tax=Arthrobacter sp. 9V TaxID=2653132 RepID=UPI0012F44FBF|nr:serine hydrolase domain-containing protein [Arthrobacter sp. 9V]VXB50729.1 Penicillin-binding protein 4 [Arthrobacter sp. 9V]